MDPELIASLKAKGLWQNDPDRHYAFYCAFCKTPRRLPLKPTPHTPERWVQIGLCAAFFTLLCWPIFSWKGVVSFIPFWMIFEMLYRTRFRAQAECPHCGFDPYLYLTDVQRARREMERYWRKKFEEKGIPFPEKPAKGQPPAGIASLQDSQLDRPPA